MAPIRRQPRGWLLPGYKYLGPFNPLDNGEPINKADKAAQKHDHAYDKYIKSGINPYWKFNKADQTFLDDLKGDYSIGGLVGKAAFNIKKAIAPSLGGEDKPGTSKGANKNNKREQAAFKRKLYFARNNKNSAKKTKMDGGNTSNEDPIQPTQVPEVRAGGGSVGGGGGAGPGGSGVGVSTGGWVGGTHFGENFVVTNVTRQWYAPIYNGHLYKKIIAPQGVNTEWQGISTPWGYFNFNCYNSHFTPNDWQRLVNEYKRWRPKSMKVQIYNLQIKQIVKSGADTLYNNDLTAGVHIFCDGSHQYPYAQHPWDEHQLPELPNAVYKLPQYGYYQMTNDITDNNANAQFNMEKWLKLASPLFMLENSSHEVLRTGEETNFSFSFNSGWVHNDRAFCPPQCDFNPLVETRRYKPYWEEAQNKFQFRRFNPYNKPSNWMPGPGCKYLGDVRKTTAVGASAGPITTTWCPPGTQNRSATDSGFGEKEPTPGQGYAQGLATDPVNGACSARDYPRLAYESGGAEADALVGVQNIDMDMTRWGTIFTQTSSMEANGHVVAGAAKSDIIWQYPMQVWNGCPISRNTPIWDKVPNTDFHTTLSSSDGTLPMSHPPGTIFVKCAKIPIPTENNADSYLNIYVTGQVSCEIVWEAEKYQTKNWRPEIRISSAEFTDGNMYNFNDQGIYNQSEEFGETMPTRIGMNRIN